MGLRVGMLIRYCVDTCLWCCGVVFLCRRVDVLLFLLCRYGVVLLCWCVVVMLCCRVVVLWWCCGVVFMLCYCVNVLC